MISAFGMAAEIEPSVIDAPKVVRGVHLTRLTIDGNKAPNADGKAKIMLGVCKGAPILMFRSCSNFARRESVAQKIGVTSRT
jgi:hypothetical protein